MDSDTPTLSSVFTNEGETVELWSIDVMSIRVYKSQSTLMHQIFVHMCTTLKTTELSTLARVCKLWCKVTFLVAMNRGFTYLACQVINIVSCN